MRERLVKHVPTWYLLAAVLAAGVVLAAGGIVYTNHVFRALCVVIVSQVEVYDETPPSTPTGVRNAENWRQLKTRFCD